MESIKAVRSFVFGPTAEEQMRKCNSLMRANVRKLDRDIASIKQVENKTRSLILAAAKRAQRNPSMAASATKETRLYARELVRARKQGQRLATSKAQLQSVQMQVKEAFAVRKIEGSIKASTNIMKDVNTLVRLPELTGTMRELSQELVKAGIIEEMVGDMLPDGEMEDEDEEAETEIDKVLADVLKTPSLPGVTATERPPAIEIEEEEEEIDEATMEQMRGRLEALRS